jgi:hypothetical protein
MMGRIQMLLIPRLPLATDLAPNHLQMDPLVAVVHHLLTPVRLRQTTAETRQLLRGRWSEEPLNKTRKLE